MKNIILAVLFIAVLPTIASAEKQMQNSNPSPEPVTEPTLGHHMQNSDPNPAQALEHVKKIEVKKRISTNAAALEDPKK